MVWAVAFEDRSTRFTRAMRPLDGDLRKVEYLDRTIDWEGIGGVFEPGDMNLGRAIKPDHLPTKVFYKGKRYGIPEVVSGCELFLVNDRFKGIVESIEPDVHQYFPVDVVWEDGTLAQKMYIFNICNRLDTVSREASTAELRNGMRWQPSTGKMVFSTTRVGDHHIWFDRHTGTSSMFYCSDKMHQALRDADISGLDSRRRETTEAM